MIFEYLDQAFFERLLDDSDLSRPTLDGRLKSHFHRCRLPTGEG